MAHNYTITTPKSSLQLDKEGHAVAAFTVTNITGVPDRGMAKVVPQGSTKPEWLTVSGNGERDFTANGVNQFDVRVGVPPGTAPGDYSFRFDMASTRGRAAEEYTEGPTVKFEVTRDGEVKSRWWIWVAAAVGLLVVAVIAWLALRPKLVDVPDVTQKPFVEAARLLQSADFKVALKGLRDDQANAGLVLDQHPKKQAEKNSVIALSVATRTDADLTLSEAESTKLTDAEAARLQKVIDVEQVADSVKVPAVVGLAGDTAMLRIYQAGLIPELMPIPAQRGRPKGIVVSQLPTGNASAAPKSTVTLKIRQSRHFPWHPGGDVLDVSPAARAEAERFRRKSLALPTPGNQ